MLRTLRSPRASGALRAAAFVTLTLADVPALAPTIFVPSDRLTLDAKAAGPASAASAPETGRPART